MEEKKIVRIKSRHGADLLGAQMLMDDKNWEVCALAKQEIKNGWLWQWWIVMPVKNVY